MTNALDLDLKRLKARAFDRAEWAEEVLRRYHAATPNLDEAVAQQGPKALQLDVRPANAMAV